MNNVSTHKIPVIKRWLAAHSRFTPTSSSWLSPVERWFSELTTKKLQRESHTSVCALNRDIRAWIETWNDDPRSCSWTKTAAQILDLGIPGQPTRPPNDLAPTSGLNALVAVAPSVDRCGSLAEQIDEAVRRREALH